MSSPGEPVATANALVKRYAQLAAVDGVSFEVHRGEVFGLLGPNGAGKTTTLEMLEGLRAPDGGSATLFGQPMSESARHLKARIGVQLQATALPEKIRVGEAFELFSAFFPKVRPIPALLEEFNLTEKTNAMADSLSGGQMQRLSIALALINEPELLFLDEPTTGLDPQARLNVWEVIQTIRAQGTTIILTTHYMEEAERLCDRIGIMDQGKLVALDTPAALIGTYARGTSIEFAESDALTDEELHKMSGVTTVHHVGNRIVLATENAEKVLSQLLAQQYVLENGLGNLLIRQGTLEDVFLSLTGRRLVDE